MLLVGLAAGIAADVRCRDRCLSDQVGPRCVASPVPHDAGMRIGDMHSIRLDSCDETRRVPATEVEGNERDRG